MGRDLVSVAVYQSITIRRRMIRVGALMYVIGSKIAKNGWNLLIDKVDKTRCTWPFQAKNRYDVTWRWPIAGLLAWDLYLVLECTRFWHQCDQVYLFLAPKWPGIPVFGKDPNEICYHTNVSFAVCRKPFSCCLVFFFFFSPPCSHVSKGARFVINDSRVAFLRSPEACDDFPPHPPPVFCWPNY